jgi:peptidoglycan/LPS O-acetylase OafA/YrhL
VTEHNVSPVLLLLSWLVPSKTLRPRPGKSGYLATLDGWRAIAIVSVMVFHDHVRRLGPITTDFLHRYGGLGVPLFFGISGLLITTRLLEEERLFGAFSLKGFYLRRMFRIQPAALLFLGMMVLAHLVFHLPFVYKGLVEALCLVRNVANWNGTLPGMRITEHFWSLSIEEQFYLVLPCLLFFIRARRHRLAVLFVAASGFFCWTVVAPHRLAYYIEIRGHHTELNLHGLLFGSGLAVLVSSPKTREIVRRLMLPSALIGVCVALTLLRAWAHHYDIVWITAAFPFLVLSTVLHPRSLPGRLLEWAPLRFIGRISYSLYLWQQLFMGVAHFAAGTSFDWVDYAPVNYLLTFAAALLSFYFIEKPAIRLGHRLAPPPTPGRSDLEETPSVEVGPALA